MMSQQQLTDFIGNSQIDSLNTIKKSKSTQAENVLWAFETSSTGCTDEECAEILGIQRTSVIARRHELIKKYPDKFYTEERRLSSHGILVDVWKCRK